MPSAPTLVAEPPAGASSFLPLRVREFRSALEDLLEDEDELSTE